MIPKGRITNCPKTNVCGAITALIELTQQYEKELTKKATFDIRYWADYHRGSFNGSKVTTTQILEDLYQLIDVIDETLLPEKDRV